MHILGHTASTGTNFVVNCPTFTCKHRNMLTVNYSDLVLAVDNSLAIVD